MRLSHLLLILALAFGSVLPHCAIAAPMPDEAVHHMAMGHDAPGAAKLHVSDACIGCATPVRFAAVMPFVPPRVAAPEGATLPALVTRTSALDPPPPRLAP